MKKFLGIVVLSFLLSGNVYASENEFPLDSNITYGKLENNLTYYIRENQI